MSAIVNWITEQRRAFLGNAVSQRDFRTQMRGKKAILLWLFYLGIFFLIVGFGYQSSIQGSRTDVIWMQTRLNTFYQAIIGVLGGFIVLATPALTALSIVSEKQRQSLDLVASSPVTFRYLLLGKMIGSFRYVWMLLVLSLPFTAVCVSVGGATWQNVLIAYALLAAHGLVLMAIGILISSVSQTAIAAIVYTYFCTIIYAIVTFFLSASSSTAFMGAMAIRDPFEAPFTIAMSPFLVASAAPTHTMIQGFALPNWLIAAALCVFLADLFLTGAASALSGYGSGETRRFRVRLAMNAVIVGAMSGWIVVNGGRSGGATPTSVEANLGFYIGLIVLSPLLPQLFAWHQTASRRFQYDGAFRIDRMFRGTPSGGLPFMMLCILLGNAAALGVGVLLGLPLSAKAIEITVYCLGYVMFWWGLTQFISSHTGDLKYARLLPFLTVLLIELISQLISVFTYNSTYRESSLNFISLISGPYALKESGFLYYGIVAAAIGFGLRFFSNTPLKERNIETVS